MNANKQLPNIVRLTLEDLGSDATPLENFIEQQQARIVELEEILRNLGYCCKCGQIVEHHTDEPFSSCACGTGEDYATRPLQKLGVTIKERDELAATVERLREACTKAVEQVPEVACILGFAEATQMKSRAILIAVKREVYVAGYMDGYNRSLQPTSTMFSQNDHKERADQYANQRYPNKE